MCLDKVLPMWVGWTYQAIGVVGMLNALVDDKSLEILIEGVVSKNGGESKRQVLSGYVKTFNIYWKAITAGNFCQPENLASAIKYQAILDFAQQDDEKLIEGKRANLKNELQKFENIPIQIDDKEILLREALAKMHGALKNFYGEFSNSDRENLIAIMQEVYK